MADVWQILGRILAESGTLSAVILAECGFSRCPQRAGIPHPANPQVVEWPRLIIVTTFGEYKKLQTEFEEKGRELVMSSS